MNVLPGASHILEDVRKRFDSRLRAVTIARSNEVYFDAEMELVPGFCAHLYKKWNARLVSVFADDARDTQKVFQILYIFALDSVGVFFILRIPVPPDKPEFTSLTNAVHAVNW